MRSLAYAKFEFFLFLLISYFV